MQHTHTFTTCFVLLPSPRTRMLQASYPPHTPCVFCFTRTSLHMPEDADDDDVSDAAIPAADASLPDLMSKLFGASRRFLWSPDMRRELSCKSDCEAKNKECNEEYSECKRDNKDDEHKHHKCTHTYKKCKRKAKKCRSKCD
ncbi:unnamed protein product [Closterium sp. Yama58-4]|nr:unnamed protein product [Closterium sp. Yama58-4]